MSFLASDKILTGLLTLYESIGPIESVAKRKMKKLFFIFENKTK